MKRLLCLLSLLGGCATAHGASPLSLTYLGVAGWSISDGQHVILIDPYFSRAAESEHATPDESAIVKHTPAHADVILVGHAHFDHALDAPAVARRTGATLIATAAVATKARAAGLPTSRIRTVRGGETLTFDGFSIGVIRSLHSLIGAGQDVETLAYFIRVAGHQILVFDTANFIEPELTSLHPDIAILATGLREAIPDYSCRLMRALSNPPHVFPTHFDVWRAAAEIPLPADTLTDLTQFTTEIHRCSPTTTVQIPKPFTPIQLP